MDELDANTTDAGKQYKEMWSDTNEVSIKK